MSTPLSYGVQDVLEIQSVALPNSAGGSAATANLDLGALAGISARTEQDELLLTYPALTTTQLPNSDTVTYTIQACASAGFGSGVVTIGTVTQTGAGGAGAAGGTFRVKLPTNCPEYVQVSATLGSGAGNCSAASMTLQLVF